MSLWIEPLAGHDRAAFSSGEPEIDRWFRERAGQDQRRNFARVYVAIDDDLGVVGFFSLSSATLRLEDLAPEVGRKLPRYDAVPAFLLGRLARDERVLGKGVGELLLVAAIRTALDAGRLVGAFAIIVDAKNEAAAHFYQRYGFVPLPSRPLRLLLASDTAARAFGQAPA